MPQDNILRPILFLTFVNDLPEFVALSNILLYAVDAEVLKTSVSRLDCIHLLADLDAINLWCITWQLYLNIAKCFTVRFGLVENLLFPILFMAP